MRSAVRASGSSSHDLDNTLVALIWIMSRVSYEETGGGGACAGDSCMGDTGENPYPPAAGAILAGERPRSDSPLCSPFGLPFQKGFSVCVEPLEPERSCPCPCSCSCAGLLYSAKGERTAPCNCPLAFMSDRVCRWPWSFAGDAPFIELFVYVEDSGVYCEDDRPWLCVCEVGAIGSAYVDAICQRRVRSSAVRWS
jgi:hypothetical protein